MMRRRKEVFGVLKEQRYEMLAPTVMAVVSITCPATEQNEEYADKMKRGEMERDWTAYISAIDGISEERDFDYTTEWGSKLREDVARILFPETNGLPYRR